MNIKSKLSGVGLTIFSIMSKLANDHNAINMSQGFPEFDAHPGLNPYHVAAHTFKCWIIQKYLMNQMWNLLDV